MTNVKQQIERHLTGARKAAESFPAPPAEVRQVLAELMRGIALAQAAAAQLN